LKEWETDEWGGREGEVDGGNRQRWEGKGGKERSEVEGEEGSGWADGRGNVEEMGKK